MDFIKAQQAGANRTAFVSPTFAHNEHLHTFNTIQSAIDWVHNSSWYSSLTSTNTATVFVYPGYYREQITCWEHIRLRSYTDHYLGTERVVTLRSAGNNSSDYPLKPGVDYQYYIEGFTIRTSGADNYIISEMVNAKFINCLFKYGRFIENTVDYSTAMSFLNCTWWCNKPFVIEGVRGNAARSIWFDQCWIYGNSPYHSQSSFGSTHATGTGAVIEMNNTRVVGNIDIKGDWDYISDRCRTRRSTTHTSGLRNTYDTDGYIHITNTTIGNGLHFASDASTKIIHNCDFNDSLSVPLWAGEADITSDVTIPIVDYIQNIQQNGNDGEIQIIDPIKPVGDNAVNRYRNIQEAVDSINTEGIVDLYESYTSLAELTIPNNTKVTIDGKRSYSLAFTGNVATLALGEELIFNRLSRITGGTVELTGNNAEFHMHSCPCGDNTLEVLCTSGTDTKCHFRNVNLIGATGKSVIQSACLTTSIKICYSGLKGATGQPAIEFTVEADDIFEARYSTFVHGDGVANKPIIYTGANSIAYKMYLCALNAALDASDFTNGITSAGNVTDAGIDY